MAGKIEILAPAGSEECVTAAVRSGADAVYVGEKEFSARAAAQNFDFAELCGVVRYCHIHGVKVYVALNTIVFDDELERLSAAIESAARADADALIIQSMGAARLAKRIVPDMRLHASTQMSVHTVNGVKALRGEGFSRVVLAREMSRDEIRAAAKVPTELEVFVHGALCMSVSGQCRFSAVLGSRSGNRGSCAQTCRLPFSVGGCGGHALSLKDNSIIKYINELEDIGIASAKIEGRMKRPEYVAAAVRACREQRDNGFIGEETQELLKNVFSRSGFTDGYYTGKIGSPMFGFRRKDDVVSADSGLLSRIRQSCKDEISNVPISGRLTARLGEKPVLSLSDGTRTVSAEAGAACERAINLPLTAEKCRAQLCKTGGTAYKFADDGSLAIDIDGEISLPLSALNSLRRSATEKLDELRSVRHNYNINNIEKAELEFAPAKKTPKGIRARLTNTDLPESFKECELIWLPLFTEEKEFGRLLSEGFKVAAEIPSAMFKLEDKIGEQLSKLRGLGINRALCHNIGAAYTAARLGFKIHGGFGLNLCNTLDLLWAEEYGFEDVELSFELTFKRINALGGKIGRGILSYGYLPLMLTVNCPVRGAGISCKSCKKTLKLTDRTGEKFPVLCGGGCAEILNCAALYISREELSRVSADFAVLRFSVENYVENVENIRDFNPNSMLKQKLTRGLYLRGVK